MRSRVVSIWLVLLGCLVAGSSSLLAQAVISGPAQMDRCDEGLFTIAFTNPSPTQTACQIVLENTPPSSEFVYVAGSGLITIPGYGTASADPVLGAWRLNAIVGGAYELPPGGTATVQFRLSTRCLAVSGIDSARVDYVDCTQPGTPLQASDSLSVEILPGAMTVTKTPATPSAGVGDLVTWTLEVRSTGLGSIKNVVVTDMLGAGLSYVSSSPSGSALGQTVIWDSGAIPALAELDEGDSVTIELTARVVACAGLQNELHARFGCDGGVVCGDTETGHGDCGDPATSSVQFIQRLPYLEFTAPAITIPYCAATTTVTIPVRNTGDGTAHDAILCPSSLGALVVSNVQGGATYSGGCFHLPDIAGGATFNLSFDVTFAEDWCTSTPTGSPLYTLEYRNDCGIVHSAYPRFGSIGASATPGLSVSKTGPAIAKYGEDVTYVVMARYTGPTSCGSGTTSIVTVIDQIPDGFPVVGTAGGTWVPGPGGTGGTVTWTFDPAVTSTSSWSLIVHIPLECGFCYTERTNSVSASATSCCGCPMSASAATITAITCDRLYTSIFSISSAELERCGAPATITDEHPFADSAALDAITFGDFVYSFIKENGLAYVPGSAVATIDGTPTGVAVVDGTSTVRFIVTDPRSVRGHTLTYVYDMQATASSSPACGESSSFYAWTSHEIPAVGSCTAFYDTASLAVEPPSMSVGISGVPTIQEDCATYPVILTFRRTSTLADPYDARLVLTGTSGVIADFAGATWSGVTPAEPPVVGPDSVEWRFADGFGAPGATASVTVPVTTRCGGPLIGLSATGHYDDLCNNTAGYNDTCSTSASASSSLRLSGDVHIRMTPEVIYTRIRLVTWRIELYNSSNGTAYNVYVDDVLGSGLVYASSSASGYTGSLTTLPNQNHLGAPINGASFLFEKIAPGERPVIQLAANLVACDRMTNTATVGWGCGGGECQPTRSDSSYVLVAPANVVSTSLAVSPTDVCAIQKATMTLKSAGIATAYNLAATTTLPAGLVYAGNPEVRVGGGSWNPASTPSGIPGPALTWTKNEAAPLAAVAPGVTIDIRFDVEANCSFDGGITQARSSYENPCGQTFLSGIGTFAVATRKPTLSLTTAQTSPAAGQPIACDGSVTWEIRVTNSGPAVASAVWVEETLGGGLTYASSTGGADGGSNSGQTTTWEILNLGVGATAVLTVTAHSTSCGALTSSTKAFWACGADGDSATLPDCLSSTYASASATATRAVTASATASLSPTSIGACDTSTTFTLTLTNTSTSAPAYSPDAKVTLPTGLSYRAGTTEINCGGGFVAAADPQQAGQVLTWYNTALTGSGNDLCALIPANGSIAVRFQIRAACYRTTAPATVDLYYYDCCAGTQYHVISNPSLTAVAPVMSVTMTPSTATLDCANPSNTVTWTITVNNTGATPAGFVRIINTLGADLVRVSGGTQIGANPLQWGWEFGPLAAGGTQSVQLVARLAAPPNDCAVARRTSTAVTTWGCTALALDGDPNTTAEYACTSSGGSVTRTATVLVPDLSISPSDISPQFTCASDGISNGRMLLTVRNTGTAAIATDFTIAYSESTTGWSGSGSFTSLGGTLPLAAGASRVLTLSNWPITCSSCSYQFTASLDPGAAICECRENNNTATLAYTPTSPDLVVASSSLVPSCAGDGQVRVQGSVTLRNQGCGSSPLTTNIPMRFTVYAGATCSGTVLDQWAQTFTGVSIAAGGGAQTFAVDRTVAYNACSPCQVSILIEADSSNVICECSGTNNTLCAAALAVSFPDLVVSGIDFSGLTCASDAFSGSVAVTVANQGCGAASAFNVGLSTSGCLTFSSQRVTSLAAGASVVVQFPVATLWSGCSTCGCMFTATIDTGAEVCECSGANNAGTATYTSVRPDLVITAFTASAANPCQPGSAQVTVRNSGCGTAPSGVVVGITGAVTGQASTSVALAAGESQTLTVPLAAAVGCGTGYSVTATVDPANAVCECNGTNNTADTTFAVSAPDLTLLNLAASCNLDDTFSVTADVRNLGGQAANGVSIRVYADGVLVHDESQSIAAGAAYALSYVTPPLRCATPHTIRIVADETNAICECSEADNEATTNAALCACPALSISKSITNVWRKGLSVWPTGAVEPGDVIEYEVVLTNSGAAIAFHVDVADALPGGLVYTTAAPGHGGEYTLSAGGSGTFAVPAGGSSLATAIHATLPVSQSMQIRYCALALSSLEQGDILTNIASGDGEEGDGTEIPTVTASSTISAARPGFRIEKAITDVLRNGSSIGTSGPVEPGDVVVYRAIVHNIGGGTAYDVELQDALPAGLAYESAGSYVVSTPAASGILGAVPGAGAFQTAIHATLAGGATLTATYHATATSGISGAVALVNVVSVMGDDGAGTPVPESDTSISDSFPDHASASIGSAKPALSVDKIVADVRRGGLSIGVVDPVLFGDVVIYRVTVRNASAGTAYGVDVVDTLPSGIAIDTSTPTGAGSYSVSAPPASGGLGLVSGATGFSTSIGATIAGGGALTIAFAARVTPSAPPAIWLTNSVSASGRDGSSAAIPASDVTLGDTSDDDVEDSDADDTGIASIRAGIPALVTEKRIDGVVRNGNAVVTGAVEPGDVLTYVLIARNVGQGPAFDVSVVDTLPPGFAYRGATIAVWPGGSSTTAPAGAPGPTLSWPLAATLQAGEAVVLSYEATVPSSVRQGTSYTNVMSASGVNGAGTPILRDSSALVPADDDLDDTSDVSVVAAQPALVTRKRVVDVVRANQSLGPITAIETGDAITYELVVTNVGLGVAYAIGVHDDLPPPLAYAEGSTRCTWPLLPWTFNADPSGGPGPSLRWDTGATLTAGNSLVLRFRAVVDGPVSSGVTYRNLLSAVAVDGGSAPIPTDNSGVVPEDTDIDDQDAADLRGLADVPALVTEKRIVAVHRAGQPSVDQRVEVGDVVTYELTVESVGTAAAFGVNIIDSLPDGFEFVPGTAAASAPSGFSAPSPIPVAGSLLFDLEATLAHGERAVLRFDALVLGPIFDARLYVNHMRATGLDETGAPVPTDQRVLVPADSDSDDASSASILGRSSLIEGMGGSISVPILRKSAETLGTGPCRGATAVVDRVWFQTDIAMLASSEFATFAAAAGAGDIFPATLLPTWARTVRADLERYSDSNLLQVDVLSSVGVRFTESPRIVAAADAKRVSVDEAAARRLAELEQVAGISVTDLVPDGAWIYLEAAGGEPVYVSERDTAWGASGTWTVLDEGIVGSSLGMGLVRQAQAAGPLLSSTRADDRYVGWVLVELMANKLIALNRDFVVQPEGEPAYIPHVRARTADAGRFDLVDASSVLFDQMSLLWGAARVLSLIEATRDAWPESERDLALSLKSEARVLLGRAVESLGAYHLGTDGRFAGRWPVAVEASTTDLGLLVVAIREALPMAADLAGTLSGLQASAVAQLVARQGANGRFSEVSSTAGVSTELAAQLAAIYGLVASGDRERADRTFDYLERDAWDDTVGFGLYRLPADDGVMPCYTALDMGLAVGALRELAAESEPERGALISERLAAFARSVLDDAALELDNAVAASATRISTNAGRGAVSGIAAADGVVLAPVLQRSLCLAEIAAEGSCGGWRALPHDPWYQTDIAMYASYTLQASRLGREDDADANLAAVDFHSVLGLPFDAYASLADAVGRATADVGSAATIDPIVVPYYAGDPYIGAAASIALAWNPASFDARVVPSALGMTLLREAQEVLQIAGEADRDAERNLTGQVLAASIVGKLAALDDLVLEGPGGLLYVPHAFAAHREAADVRMVPADPTSVLFDQISLLLGLSEAYSLLHVPAAAALIPIQGASAASLAARVEAFVDIVLGTLETAHLRPLERALADLATPSGIAWTAGDEISAATLGLVAEALEGLIASFGPTHRLSDRARALLADEVSFLRGVLWDGTGGYRDQWVAEGASSACSAPTLTGQLGALRALLAGNRVLGSETSEIRSTLLAFDSRFWDEELEVYVSRLDHLAWCMTPLDFAFVVDVVPQAASFLDAADASVVRSHVARHVDRALDALDLQIPARQVDEQENKRLFAPVFDRRVCLEPVAPYAGLTWTRPGDVVRYTVEAENPTDETFLALALDDLLPEGVTLTGSTPGATVDGRALRWTFDRLEPGEMREWTIDVRVEEGRALGETFTNCATLTYTDAAGEARPTREACADVALGTADDARAASLRSAAVTYRTDQAMRLAVALDDLADRDGLGPAEVDARAASLANLGVLLGESGLGVRFSLAPIWQGNDASNERLAALAEAAGLPGVPSLGAPIFLPSSGGVPIVDRGVGFIQKAGDITPAAVGWALAREAKFLEASAEVHSGLTAALASFVSLDVDGQVAWIEETVRLSSNGAYLVHGVTPTENGDSVSYSVSDPRSLAYDQASLLVGLTRTAAAGGVDPQTARLAAELADGVFAQLGRHIAADGTLMVSLADNASAAAWADVAVAARALSEVVAALPSRETEAKDAIASLARRALEARPTELSEEAARIDVLLVAGQVLDDAAIRGAGLAAWRVFFAAARDADGRLVLSTLARAGWRYSPAEAALAFELLGDVARADPGLAAESAALAADILLVDVLEERIQLRAALGYWSEHVGIACFDAAPVFAIRIGPIRGEEPLWALRRP